MGDEMEQARAAWQRGREVVAVGRSRSAGGLLLRALVPRTALALLRKRGGDGVRRRARDVAALFADIEGCTRLCEDLPARDMEGVIESYFSAYLDAVRSVGGEVTEIMGDGFLALFEGPGLGGNVRAAFDAAVEIQAQTRTLNRRRRAGGPITVNIGLNAGRALVGLTCLRGRSGERCVYAARGPVTNVAARLCALARGGQILTTRAVADLLPAGARVRGLGPQSLRNVGRPVEVVEVLPGRALRPGASALPWVDRGT
jgi:class 3 adenylate cyclase